MTGQEKRNEKLRLAAFEGDLETMNDLIADGVDLNAQDEEGYTALIDAVQEPNKEAVSILLNAGTDIEKVDEENATALMWAVRSGFEENYDQSIAVVRMLIERGADVNARTESGATALIYAVSHDKPEMVEILLKAGADPNLETDAGWTALDYANDDRLMSGETKDLLLGAGAISKRGTSGHSRV
ncbi:MAG TPA: ankyrin repeat domain-containing protein [Nitrososphaera sp.]|jgi:ankyrin repeat protein